MPSRPSALRRQRVYARAASHQVGCSVAFRRWKSATDSNRRRAFQGWKGVHLILANPPWRQLRERAQKIQGDKKHVEGILSQSHCVAQFNTAQERQMARKMK